MRAERPPLNLRRARWTRPLALLALAGATVGGPLAGAAAADPLEERVTTSDAWWSPAAQLSSLAASPTTIPVAEERHQVAPGVELTEFERLDPAGWLRGDLLRVDLADERVSVDLLTSGAVAGTARLSDMAARAGAVAGVNGDFFDINNTGAAIGPAVQDGELVKGGVPNRSRAFGITDDRLGRVVDVFLDGRVTLPDGTSRTLTGFNQHQLAANGIALFTGAWGTATRAGVASGAARVHEVVVADGRVVATGAAVTDAAVPVDGFVLIGRDAGADALAGLVVGDPVAVEYGPRVEPDGRLTAAVGGNQVLLRDGAVVRSTDTAVHPRTAVGVSEDGRTLFLLTVDGRQEASRGTTIEETGRLLQEFGAHSGLNLDGGGSSTMLARHPGGEPRLFNAPSDGVERSTPNGLGVFVAPGSGELTGLRIEPAVDVEHPTRVFPGLSRTFGAVGHDETFSPATTTPVFAVDGDHATVTTDGVVTGRTSGPATLRATDGPVTTTLDLDVLDPLERIEVVPGRASLAEADASTVVVVDGFDADGTRARIEPADVTVTLADPDVAEVTPTVDGFRITAKVDAGGTLATVAAADTLAYVPVTVGLADATIADTTSTAGWTTTHARAAVTLRVGGGGPTGQDVLRLGYDFTRDTATRAAYLGRSPYVEIEGQPQRLGVWIDGDGNGAWLRGRIVDAAGTLHTINYAAQIDWTGWRYVEATIPDGVAYPISFRDLYPVETRPAAQYQGEIGVSGLVARVPTTVEVPSVARAADPLLVQGRDVAGERWTFAVVADSQFEAAHPQGINVELARRTLRAARTADPDLIVIAGDLTELGHPADMRLARQVLDEELGDDVPWYYLPGNHEHYGTGNLDAFSAEFGPGRHVVDHRGVRFVLANTAFGTFRGSDFAGLVELREELEAAATDPAVEHVVVIGHHPTVDPNPQAASQLTDRREVALLERWLTEFRTASGGKGAAYIAGHAHVADLRRVDGVPYHVVPPAGAKIYGPTDAGGFSGWALYGVDPTATGGNASITDDPWLEVALHPLVEGLELEAPTTLRAGQTVELHARGALTQGRSFPLRAPATVTWRGRGLALAGDPTTPIQPGRPVAAVLDPETLELTAVRPGRVELVVEADGQLASVELTVTGPPADRPVPPARVPVGAGAR
ncbi:phosphodiester glycosidase family protein [Egicoccus halophilus]|uniref:phosphodiester glycosidase family protein n=1 Tax=Egicoccus halophilus TaxID=1670830 RepID=UPI00102F8567|nr:phosphodiester glycosidase family protein [Egicoccus halophilus]